MARARVKLARIVDERKRKITLKKRRLALISKLETLCVLCKVAVCMIVCDGLNDQGADNVMAWPSRQKVERMLPSFMSVPEQKENKKMVTHEKFLESMLVKEKNKLQVIRKKNNQMEIEELLHKLHIAPTSIEPTHKKLSQAYFYIEEFIKNIEEMESPPPKC